jgi:hypothetical protein
MTTQELYSIRPNEYGWRRLPNGNCVKLGNDVKLGNCVTLGNDVKLGNCVKLGNDVKLGNCVTSAQLNAEFIAAMPEVFLAWKWVTKERQSPNFDGGTVIDYPPGAIIEAVGVRNDQQCGLGLHVLRVGYRPEWCGLCDPDHRFICLEVEVRREDVLFGGLPTMDTKLRVRKLKVLG